MRASLKRQPTRVYPRGAPFAAIIPGDGVAEQVFTTGIQSFLCAPARFGGRQCLSRWHLLLVSAAVCRGSRAEHCLQGQVRHPPLLARCHMCTSAVYTARRIVLIRQPRAAAQELVQHGDHRARAVDLVPQRASVHCHAPCVRAHPTAGSRELHALVRAAAEAWLTRP